MMKNVQVITDKTAIFLSALCAIHCLVLPLLLVLLPSLTILSVDEELFHIWMLIAVVPTSLYALTMGCRKHKRYSILAFGILGLVMLAVTGFLGHDVLGEAGEKVMILVSSGIIALGHIRNHLLCKKTACHS